MQDLLKRLSGLGDPTLLLLCGLAVFLYLWCDDQRRMLARRWAVAFGLCILLTIVTKFTTLTLMSGSERSAFTLRSPSGHVAIGTGFYGCCALMLAAGRRQVAQVLICLAAALLIAMLAATRLLLGLHTAAEIAMGFAIGSVCLLLFLFCLPKRTPIMPDAGQLISLVLLIGVAHYSHVDGEPLIRHLAQKIDSLRGEQLNFTEGSIMGMHSQMRGDSARR
jgi:membrane-associated phospholipid phosphatase